MAILWFGHMVKSVQSTEDKQKNIIWCWVKQFEETGRLYHQLKCHAEWPFIHMPHVADEPRKHLQESYSMNASISYRIQLPQLSTDLGEEIWSVFWNELSDFLENEADILNRIPFSDEAYFHSDGYVNKQNTRCWDLQKSRGC
jgi:hypothetical protein